MKNGFSHSVRGASHEVRGTVCQDYSAYHVCDSYAIAVVADGHGSKKHFRSNLGSEFAVRASLETVEAFYKNPDKFEKNFVINSKYVLKLMQKHIIACWNDKVNEHFEKNPVTDSEKADFTEEEFAKLTAESIYGTTLIVAVIGRKFTFGLQIGDGSLVVIDDKGDASMPILYNESAPANVTASMCNTNAIHMFNSFVIWNPSVMAAFVSTDGLYTSFNSDYDFLDYHTIITSNLHSFETFDRVILNNLTKRSRAGTQDDTSLSGVFDVDSVRGKADFLKHKVEENKKNAASRRAEQLANMEKQKLKTAMRKSSDNGGM